MTRTKAPPKVLEEGANYYISAVSITPDTTAIRQIIHRDKTLSDRELEKLEREIKVRLGPGIKRVLITRVDDVEASNLRIEIACELDKVLRR